MVDLVFVVDSSRIVRDQNPPDGSYDNWELLLQFVVNVINKLTIGSSATRIGLVKFFSAGQNEFYLNTYSTKTDVINRVLGLSYVGSQETNIAEGLRIMHEQQFVSARGDRSGVKNVAIVVTAGESNVETDRTIPEAEAARAKGIRVYTVGITSAVNVAELRSMSSLPQEINQDYFVSNEVTVLDGIVDTLVSETCTAPPQTTPRPTGMPTPAAQTTYILIVLRFVLTCNFVCTVCRKCTRSVIVPNVVSCVTARCMLMLWVSRCACTGVL